jgi:hypothetical protein
MYFPFFWHFWELLLNQVDQTLLNFHFCKYE